MCALLKISQCNEVLADLKRRKKPSISPVDLYGYVQNNAANIDYAHYISEGWFIGSGVVESDNKSVLQHRLKQAGMRWNSQTVQYLLTLRAKYKSHLWVEEVVSPVLKFLLENANNHLFPATS